MFYSCKEVLSLTGNGETEKEAFQDMFNKIKPELVKKYPGIILQIEPQNMTVTDAVIHTYTEKFLGVFFSRKRTMYQLKADVIVKTCSFSTEDIKYRREEEKLSLARHIIEMR